MWDVDKNSLKYNSSHLGIGCSLTMSTGKSCIDVVNSGSNLFLVEGAFNNHVCHYLDKCGLINP